MQDIEIKLLKPAAILPTYSSEGAGGLDIRACIDAPILLEPGKTVLIPTGFAMNMKNPEIACLFLPRSGLGSKKGIVLGNLVGLIDSDFVSECQVPAWNRSDEAYLIMPNERIAQAVFVPVLRVQWKVVEAFSETAETTRGQEGFGQSGRI